MHNLSTFFQFLRHLTTDTVQFIKICQNCDQHTQHDRDPDKADFNMRQCTRGLYRICHIAALFQEDSDNETCQSHSTFYEKSLEYSDQSRYTCIFLIFRIIDHIWLHFIKLPSGRCHHRRRSASYRYYRKKRNF